MDNNKQTVYGRINGSDEATPVVLDAENGILSMDIAYTNKKGKEKEVNATFSKGQARRLAENILRLLGEDTRYQQPQRPQNNNQQAPRPYNNDREQRNQGQQGQGQYNNQRPNNNQPYNNQNRPQQQQQGQYNNNRDNRDNRDGQRNQHHNQQRPQHQQEPQRDYDRPDIDAQAYSFGGLGGSESEEFDMMGMSVRESINSLTGARYSGHGSKAFGGKKKLDDGNKKKKNKNNNRNHRGGNNNYGRR